MIQHAELDANSYYIEILRKNGSQYYYLPEFISQLAPQGYTARVLQIDNPIVEFVTEEGVRKTELRGYSGRFF